MARLGMDVDEVERVGNSLKQQAQQIEHLIHAIGNLINQAIHSWDGQDAHQFNEWWNSQHKPALTQAAHAVEGLGQAALNNAREQRQVSGH